MTACLSCAPALISSYVACSRCDAFCTTRRFRTRCVDVVAVKGKTIGVSVYEILSRKSDTTNAELHDKIVETYERFLTDTATLMQIQAQLNFKNVNLCRLGFVLILAFVACSF